MCSCDTYFTLTQTHTHTHNCRICIVHNFHIVNKLNVKEERKEWMNWKKWIEDSNTSSITDCDELLYKCCVLHSKLEFTRSSMPIWIQLKWEKFNWILHEFFGWRKKKWICSRLIGFVNWAESDRITTLVKPSNLQKTRTNYDRKRDFLLHINTNLNRNLNSFAALQCLAQRTHTIHCICSNCTNCKCICNEFIYVLSLCVFAECLLLVKIIPRTNF